MILEGKTVLVTGVGKGLGRECAASALRDGANVVLAARTAETAGRHGRRTRSRPATGGHPRDRHHRPRFVRRPGAAPPSTGSARWTPSIQVAAYENVWGGLYDLSFEAWRKAFETNVIGALTVIRPVAEAMKAGGGGSVVLIGSQSMFQPALPQSGYAASKGALLSAMYYLVDELGPDNIRCQHGGPLVDVGTQRGDVRDRHGPQPGTQPRGGARRHRGQLPAAPDDRGRRGGRCGRVLRLGLGPRP